MVRIDWKFTNGHMWCKEFDSAEDAEQWIKMCALDTHPSVVELNTTTIESDRIWVTNIIKGGVVNGV